MASSSICKGLRFERHQISTGNIAVNGVYEHRLEFDNTYSSLPMLSFHRTGAGSVGYTLEYTGTVSTTYATLRIFNKGTSAVSANVVVSVMGY